ncbi:outer envelope protein 64, chloroplastic [Amaranthus tricolor]|uniref:outer envelope protein 64, chloroplastic n=1 Tax=Amaranthus tricolor TaxID=29722 RepID=UPI002587D72A|nr:outer envelope protein 64, chloroplastic [Amaranthus tricolor]
MASSNTNLWVMLGLGLAGTILLMTRKLKRAIMPDFGAFIQKLELLPPPQPAPPKAPHPLTDLTFAVSDLFDIEGYVTGFGNPDWAKTHEASLRTASVVLSLVDGGAKCIGKTTIDEMAYSVSGESKHYGTPTNPGAPDRVPAGSCSGAAVSVAAKLVDFSLGIDTVGGVRLPAGFCGVIGFRASQGAISQSGIIPVSASLDAIGCFARDPNVLRRVVHVMMKLQFATQRSPKQIIIADDCFELLKIHVDRVIHPVIRSTEKLFGRQALKHENLGSYLSSKVPSLMDFSASKINAQGKTSTLTLLADVMQSLLRYEFMENHGEWINSVKPDVDSAIGALSREGNVIHESEIQKMNQIRTEMRLALNSLLKDDGVLVIPTFPHPPPKVGGKDMSSETYLSPLFSLLSIASLSGCCQVTVPLGYHNKSPISVSFIARQGGDRFLLDTIQTMYSVLQEQVDTSESKSTPSTYSMERSAEAAKEKGNLAFKDKQWQKAINHYTEAIKLCGSNATYYSNRAAAYLELASFRQAVADCTRAINLDKKNVKAYLRRGTAQEMLGYYKEATEDFRYALVLEPTNKRAAASVERLKNLFQ